MARGSSVRSGDRVNTGQATGHAASEAAAGGAAALRHSEEELQVLRAQQALSPRAAARRGPRMGVGGGSEEERWRHARQATPTASPPAAPSVEEPQRPPEPFELHAPALEEAMGRLHVLRERMGLLQDQYSHMKGELASVAEGQRQLEAAQCSLVGVGGTLDPEPEGLGRTPDLANSRGVDLEMEKALLAEIEEVLGSSHRKATEGRLGRIEAILRTTYNALPKNAQGRLEDSAVRYAMHRLFVQRHAWFVQGLDPVGESWNTSLSSVIMQDQLPAYVLSLFERRIGHSGFDLHELAVMAATFENLVHAEALGRLEHTYRALLRSTKDPLSREEALEVTQSYMAMYVLGMNFSSTNREELVSQRDTILEVYPSWPATQKFLLDVYEATAPKRDELAFESIATVIEEIGERYGRWQDHECQSLKAELLKREDGDSGRVRLADFYGGALDGGHWQFSESVQYLRQLGALDESDPANLRVIVPNYIQSPSNCVASSRYYSVCCMDECEEIMRHVEDRVGAPEASAAELAAVVESLPSNTSSAERRTLSPTLRQKLQEVAEHHGGRVPLHGRLFTQWMHYAHPRECQYPHTSGTTAPMRAEDWYAKTGLDPSVSADEMRAHAAVSNKWPNSKEGHGGERTAVSMWTMDEELIVSRPTPQAVPARSSPLRGVIFLATIASGAIALWQTMSSAAEKAPQLLLPKYNQKLKV
ncbi:unnamed protein product [Prorocentrum cordatum]|uniref:Uncharacterized protein n=1 Tax=Prorocentrum cordatum TaxID=2364126 RepID=A0ABN9QYD9_9DINO|nr:unnamed protein product [Polarella glacialis]